MFSIKKTSQYSRNNNGDKKLFPDQINAGGIRFKSENYLIQYNLFTQTQLGHSFRFVVFSGLILLPIF